MTVQMRSHWTLALAVAAPLILGGSLLILLRARSLNGFLLGEETGRTKYKQHYVEGTIAGQSYRLGPPRFAAAGATPPAGPRPTQTANPRPTGALAGASPARARPPLPGRR